MVPAIRSGRVWLSGDQSAGRTSSVAEPSAGRQARVGFSPCRVYTSAAARRIASESPRVSVSCLLQFRVDRGGTVVVFPIQVPREHAG